MQGELSLIMVIAAVTLVVGWLLATWRCQAKNSAVIASLRAEANLEVATMRERLRKLEEQQPK